MNKRKITIEDMFLAKYKRLPDEGFERVMVDFISKISDVYDQNFDEITNLTKQIKEMKLGLREASSAIKNRRQELGRREEVMSKIGSYCRGAVGLSTCFSFKQTNNSIRAKKQEVL